MKAAVFLISLCLILMGGADRVLAGGHSKGCCYTRTYHHEMMPDGKRSLHAAAGNLQYCAVSPDNDFFIADGLDEEDLEENLARKFRQAGKFYELLFLQSTLAEPSHLFRTNRFLFHLDSDKYIFQRVFRV